MDAQARFVYIYIYVYIYIELNEIQFLAIDMINLLDFCFVVLSTSFVQAHRNVHLMQNNVQFHVLLQFIDSTSLLIVYFAFCSGCRFLLVISYRFMCLYNRPLFCTEGQIRI